MARCGACRLPLTPPSHITRAMTYATASNPKAPTATVCATPAKHKVASIFNDMTHMWKAAQRQGRVGGEGGQGGGTGSGSTACADVQPERVAGSALYFLKYWPRKYQYIRPGSATATAPQNSAERVCTSKPTQVREARAKRAPRLARGSDTGVAGARGARGEWDTSSRLPTGGTLRTRVGEEGRNPQGRKHELEELQRVLAAECPRANEACPHQHTAPTSRTPPPSRRNTRTAHGTRRQTQEAR